MLQQQPPNLSGLTYALISLSQAADIGDSAGQLSSPRGSGIQAASVLRHFHLSTGICDHRGRDNRGCARAVLEELAQIPASAQEWLGA